MNYAYRKAIMPGYEPIVQVMWEWLCDWFEKAAPQFDYNLWLGCPTDGLCKLPLNARIGLGKSELIEVYFAADAMGIWLPRKRRSELYGDDIPVIICKWEGMVEFSDPGCFGQIEAILSELMRREVPLYVERFDQLPWPSDHLTHELLARPDLGKMGKSVLPPIQNCGGDTGISAGQAQDAVYSPGLILSGGGVPTSGTGTLLVAIQ